MLEYTFRITHRGCWTETLTDEFPAVTATIVYSYRVRGDSVTMVEAAHVEPDEVDSLVEWLQAHEVMSTAQLINYDADRETAVISLVGDYDHDPETEPVLNVLLNNQCFPAVPATVSNGREHWSVLTADHEHASRAHAELQSLGALEVDALKSPQESRLLTGIGEIRQAIQDLSPRQREVLLRAIEHGYYESPRGCNIETLAELDDANVSTVGEHLRRSEAKILAAAVPILQ